MTNDNREETCRVCGEPWGRHLDLVERHIVNHEFSRDGQLIPVDRGPKKATRRQEVMVVPGVDIMLRQLLIEKGILDASDFESRGAYGGIPHRDQFLGRTEDTERGMRSSAESAVPDSSGEMDSGSGDSEQ